MVRRGRRLQWTCVDLLTTDDLPVCYVTSDNRNKTHDVVNNCDRPVNSGPPAVHSRRWSLFALSINREEFHKRHDGKLCLVSATETDTLSDLSPYSGAETENRSTRLEGVV
ncbi:hypothetical protein LSAT2_029222 [Lamellibrachia satsuma]|nr:hypothetical protein LSAT2_029222 [Lamellibrachia satsuma]